MKSDVFMLNSDAGRMAATRYSTENFARDLNLDRHDTLRLELLTEEMAELLTIPADLATYKSARAPLSNQHKYQLSHVY